jgi:hypothetical protein
MDDTHVYVSVNLAIPKADLALDDEEARRDAVEFGDRGIAYTLKNKVSGYLQVEHNAYKNSTPWFAGPDLRAYWRIGEKIFDGHEKQHQTALIFTNWDEVLTGAVGTIVIVGSDEGDRAAAVRRLARCLGRPVYEVSARDEDQKPAPQEAFHFTLEAGHAARAVVYITELVRSEVDGGRLATIVSSTQNAIGAKRKNSIMVFGYHDMGAVPDFIRAHPDVRFLFPDSVGCTAFGQGYRG